MLRIAPRERREFTFFMPKAALKFWTKKRRKVLASLNNQALKNQFFILKSKIKFITLPLTSTSSQLPALTQACTFFIPFESGVCLQVLETLSPQYWRGLTTCSALTPGRGLLTSFPWTLTDPRPSPLPSRNTDTWRSNKYTSACLKAFTCSLWTIKYIPNTPVEQHSKPLSYWALPTCPVLSLIALLNRPHSPGKLNSSSPPDRPFASCTRASAHTLRSTSTPSFLLSCKVWFRWYRKHLLPARNHFSPFWVVCSDVSSVAKSYPTLWDPMDCSLPGSSVHWISQARTLEWVAISSSRGSSPSRDQTCISCISWIGRQILYHCATWEAPPTWCSILFLPILGLLSHRLCYSQSWAAEEVHPRTRYVASGNGCGGNIHTMVDLGVGKRHASQLPWSSGGANRSTPLFLCFFAEWEKNTFPWNSCKD